MDKEQLFLSIQQADNVSLRNGAANRILQLLQKQRYSNNENSVKRWVWELCQNAKDVCNSTGKVKISIDYDENQKKVLFKHNGRAFSMSNILSLINQSSSKDRNDQSERKSGKFGTGFITTHLLSEIVNISGILESDSVYSKFNISLNRRGKEKNEIIAAMESAVDDLQKCTPINILDFSEAEYNTVFEYELDEYGLQVARDGLENLRVSAPFVLAMLSEIEEITIESTGEKFRYNQEINCGHEKATVSEIVIEEKGKMNPQTIYVLNFSEGNVSILIALEFDGQKLKILPYSKQQSKLFCDFPLIGTEDFPFPVLISSQDFNPTEPRDGVFLTCNNKARMDEEIETNRAIIEKACNLYKELLEYAARKHWDGIYNITRIDAHVKKEWYDVEWINGIVENCKNIILHVPIICTESGSMVELLDYWDDEQVYIISDRNEHTREKIWQLLSYIMPERIPRKKDIHEWYGSLWSGCNKYTFDTLSELVNSYGNIEFLDSQLTGIGWKAWLQDYYVLIDDHEERQKYISANEINILPNQNGEFCSIGDLCYDAGLIDEYKSVLYELGDDVKSWLLYAGFAKREWFQCGEYSNENILKRIEQKLEPIDQEEKDHVLLKIAFLYEISYEQLDVQRKICDYAKHILGLEYRMAAVSVISENLLKEALKRAVTCVADRISECGTVDGLSRYIKATKENTITYLADFIEFIVKQGFENLITKVTKPILPNQNGNFLSKENIFVDNEIDNVLKDIACLAGYDIREELLMKDVLLELPKNREKSNADLTTCITRFVEDNRTTKEPDIRSGFNRLLIWINDNQDEAERILPSLCKNKHYLYDDEEIANNIKQAETLTSIMSKYNIGSADKLEEIIRNSEGIPDGETVIEKECITEEVLLQYGIDSEDALNKAFSNADFSSRFIRESKHNVETYEYVRQILDRSKKNILLYLETQQEYDLSEVQEVANTIFVVKKDGKQIYVLARPSDGGEVRIFYRTEMDILDYSMDWEFWVEDGKSVPQKITFGKLIKLTGLNRIPLRGM